MSMRLLTRSEITKGKAADRQREIEEGLKLATKVDSLRERLAEEEATMEEYKGQTIAEIQKEIIAHEEILDGLRSEIRVLEERRIEALKPLHAEWAAVNNEKTVIERIESDLEVKKALIVEKELAIANMQDETTDEYVRVSNRKERLDSQIEEAEEKARLAREAFAEAQQVRDTAIHETKMSSKSLEEREGWVGARELIANEKEEELRTKEIELAKRSSLLDDREKTIDRSIKRTKT